MVDNFDKRFKRTAYGMVSFFIAANLVFWGGLIVLGFWLLNHYGVI